MKKIIKLLLSLFVFSCAVQGPIPGGEIDEYGPKLIKVHPRNNSTTLQANDKITLFFDEAIDPNSVYDSFQISNDEYKIRAVGKKVIIRPKDKWNSESILNISVSRELTDYYKNSINSPLNFHFSLGKEIPKGIIKGEVLDIVDIIEKYTDANYKSNIYEVALYERVDSEIVLVTKTQTDQDLNFSFNALDIGTYSILAVKDFIYSPSVDISQRDFAVYNEDIQINKDSLEYDISINLGEPIIKKNISSIDFINNYYVKYDFTDGSSQFGIIDTVINNLEKNLSGVKHNVTLELENNFENYLTDVFEYIIPDIKDTISPLVVSCELVDSRLFIKVSEPLQIFYSDSIFYIDGNGSDNIYLSGFSYDIDIEPLQINGIDLPVDYGIEDTLSIHLDSNLIKDFSGNAINQSVLQIADCIHSSVNKIDSNFGGLSGEVSSNSNKLVVAAYNIETRESWRTIVEDKKFLFSSLPSGDYFLQVYENYKMQSKIAYPYFPGKWDPIKGSVDFSDFVGPVEIRKNWDIDGINIKFD